MQGKTWYNSGNPTLTFQIFDHAGIFDRNRRQPYADPITIPPQAFPVTRLCKSIAIQHCPDKSRWRTGEGIACKKTYSIGVVMKKFPGKVEGPWIFIC